jgi:hypothetical protein
MYIPDTSTLMGEHAGVVGSSRRGRELVDYPTKLRAVVLGSAHVLVAKRLPASGLAQLPRLRGNASVLPSGDTLASPYLVGPLCPGITHQVMIRFFEPLNLVRNS